MNDQKTFLTFDDVLIQPAYSEIRSRDNCNVSVFLSDTVGFAKPIIASNMDTITGFKMFEAMRHRGAAAFLPRTIPIEEIRGIFDAYLPEKIINNKIFVSVGAIPRVVGWSSIDTKHKEFHRINEVIDAGYSIVVDIAHGHSENMKTTLEYIRSKIAPTDPRLIVAGNVATWRAVLDLKHWGANVIKVGIGSGSVCTTRTQTGVGVPQFSAIRECSKAKIPIIADGGIRSAGDAAKALAAGASMVMIGGMLAGTDMTPNWTPRKFELGEELEFRGMASLGAKANMGLQPKHEEGISTTTLARPEGSTNEVIDSLVDGIKSSMSYVGATTLKEFQERANFIEVSGNTYKENHAHFGK
jgi:IMP dehydrogenase